MPASPVTPTSHVLKPGHSVRLRIDGVELPGEVVAVQPSGWVAAKTADGRVWLDVNMSTSKFGFSSLVLLERRAALSDMQAIDRIATAIASRPTRVDCADVEGAAELRPSGDRLLCSVSRPRRLAVEVLMDGRK